MKTPNRLEGGLTRSSSPSYRNLLKAAIASSMISGGSLACSAPQTMPGQAPATTNVAQKQTEASVYDMSETAKTSEAEHESADESIPADAKIFKMLITGNTPNGAWPGVPAQCVYTGVVLDYDQDNKPHTVVLENMCLQRRNGQKNVYEGRHLKIVADEHGHFSLPFNETHLEEERGRLYFVLESGDETVREELDPGEYEPGTLSFEHKLDAYNIQ